jgi:hypothetical protein
MLLVPVLYSKITYGIFNINDIYTLPSYRMGAMHGRRIGCRELPRLQ